MAAEPLITGFQSRLNDFRTRPSEEDLHTLEVLRAVVKESSSRYEHAARNAAVGSTKILKTQVRVKEQLRTILDARNLFSAGPFK